MDRDPDMLFRAMADRTRRRLLSLLAAQELSVGELVEVLRQPQSTVSRHLKVLREAELLTDRRCGTTTLYAAGAMDGLAEAGVPEQLREQLLRWAAAQELERPMRNRLAAVLERRRAEGTRFFETVGTRWDQLRVEAFGECFQMEALAALLPADWTVADIGAGTGYLLPVLAARFRRVIAIEPVEAMLEVARSRPELRRAAHVEFRAGGLTDLPLAGGEIDLAIASLVLHHVEDPGRALSEIRRAVRDGGRLLVIEQEMHENAGFRERMGDRWFGFEPVDLSGRIKRAGFDQVQTSRLTSARPTGRSPGDAPALFAVTGTAKASEK